MRINSPLNYRREQPRAQGAGRTQARRILGVFEELGRGPQRRDRGAQQISQRAVSFVGFLAGAGLAVAACSSSSADSGARPAASGSASAVAADSAVPTAEATDAGLPGDAASPADA